MAVRGALRRASRRVRTPWGLGGASHHEAPHGLIETVHRQLEHREDPSHDVERVGTVDGLPPALGVRVEPCRAGEVALQVLEPPRPGLLVHMPVVDGATCGQ